MPPSSYTITSKQNSDAMGMHYQWGRKDPYTFATSSLLTGIYDWNRGAYPVKIYTIDGVLIYQDDIGRDNKDKQPVGGIIQSITDAASMMETIKNPITFYYGGNTVIISQSGMTRDLWDYYWTSWSRGTDGAGEWSNIEGVHTSYLHEYRPKKTKSIFDSCPFGFRIASNGTLSQFSKQVGYGGGSYLGRTWSVGDIKSWFLALGGRSLGVVGFEHTGNNGYYAYSTSSNSGTCYSFMLNIKIESNFVINRIYSRSTGYSVRCIEVSPPRPTDEIRLATEVSIPVNKTVTLKVCSINGGVKIHLRLLQVVNNGEVNMEHTVSTLLRYIL